MFVSLLEIKWDDSSVDCNDEDDDNNDGKTDAWDDDSFYCLYSFSLPFHFHRRAGSLRMSLVDQLGGVVICSLANLLYDKR